MGDPLRSGIRKTMESLVPRVNSSWRVDETYVSIRAKWHYLYRAVDKHGKTVDFLLRRDRGIAAAQTFFRKALATNAPRAPRKVTLDGHVPSRRALWLLRREHPCWRNVKVRTRWLVSSRSRTQPSRSPASSWPVEFARDSSRLASGIGGGIE